MAMQSRKVLAALSGGVDSAVAVRLLQQQGHEVEGVFMSSGYDRGAENFGPREQAEPLPERLRRESARARAVADFLGIRLHIIDCQADFDRLIDHFLDEYGRGRTPNPCLRCNRALKFGRLFDLADSLGAACLATGHYARRGETAEGEAAIFRALDASKDQSYALFAIPRRRLERILLPLGDLHKRRTRQLARDWGLPSSEQAESQEICFVAGDYLDLLRLRRPELLRPGPIVDQNGREVGRHEGVAGFTIGQRRGLKVAAGEPRYVTRIDAAMATVHLGPDELLWQPGLLAEEMNWHIDPPAAGRTLRASVKIRYRHQPAAALVRVLDEGQRAEIRFDEPQRAITPGQGAVMYDGERLLGGGWIVKPLTAAELGR